MPEQSRGGGSLLPDRVHWRVDARLVHATLMNAWVPFLGAEWILVADGEVADDLRRRTICVMSAMDAVDILFAREEALVEALRSADRSRPGIVLFSSLAAAERAHLAALGVKELNVGHVPKDSGAREVHPAVHLGEPQIAIMRRLHEGGVRVYVQPLPNDKQVEPPLGEVAITEEIEVVNERGLHLRAAHVLAHLAGKLEASVEVGRDGEMVNAKSLLGLTTLGAGLGARLRVVVRGPGAQEAMGAIRDLFARGFDEGRVEKDRRGVIR